MSTVAQLRAQASSPRGSLALTDVATSCRLATRELGFEYFLLLIRFPGSGIEPLQVVISGLPSEWDRLYDHYQWATIDPLIEKAITTTVPFTSDEVNWSAAPRVEAMRAALHLHGLDHIVTVPLRGPVAEIGLMNFVRSETLPAAADSRNALISHCQLYSHRIYATLVDQVRNLRSRNADSARLSLRERQVLSLAAMGDRAKVIASKLEITPRTVTYFFRRAAEKIGADTLRGAICKAAMRGELQLVEYPYRLQRSTVFLKEACASDRAADAGAVDRIFARKVACQI